MRSRTKAVAVALSALALVAGLAAQQTGVHPISGRRYAPVMGYQGAPWLERGERDEEEAPDVALNVLKIPKGASRFQVLATSKWAPALLVAPGSWYTKS